jgi:hypothetical protein
MIFSGLAKVQGNLGVPRMLTYILEHEYRWFTGHPRHASFWDPPIFYPAKNTAAYSETLAGVAPFYFVWRAFGAPIDIAYPLWLLSISSLNFLAAFLFLKDAMGRGDAASGFGAFLFSFASMRLGYIGLSQLLPGFYLVLAVHALVRLFREEDPKKGLRWTALFAGSFVLQTYACFYVAWFLGLSLGLAACWSLALPSARAQAVESLRRHGPGLASAVVLIGIAVLPFLLHSIRASKEVGFREYDEIEIFLPRPASWLYSGADHWLYGGLSGIQPFTSIPTLNSEHAIGLGPATTVLAILGLWNLRRTALGRMLGAVAATLFALTLLLPGGASLWALVYLVVPGAGAIRAVARVSLILLLPAAAGAAAVVDESRWKKPLLVAVALFSLLEQGRTSPVYDRREARDSAAAIARRVDPASEAFWFTVDGPPESKILVETLPLRIHVDAMMASLECGVPTVNGYSGWNPPNWPFENLTFAPSDRGAAGIEKCLLEWSSWNGIERRRIQWVRKGR